MGDEIREGEGLTPKEVKLGRGETVSDAETRFRNVLAASRDIIYQLDLRTLTYDYVSPSVEPMLGYPPDDFVAGGLELVASLTHPDDLDRLREQVARLTAPGDQADFDLTFEYRLRRKAGDYRWVSDSHTLVRDPDGAPVALVGNVRDVTDRRAAEEATREREARFRAAVEAAPSSFFILKAVRGAGGEVEDFEFVELNSLGAALIGIPRERAVGGRLLELLPANRDLGFFDKYRRVLETREVLVEEFSQCAAGHDDLWLHQQVVPLGDGIAITTTDVSGRRRAEEASAFLAEASSLLASSLDHEATLANLTRLAVPRLADWCSVYLVGEDGAPRRLAVAHADPAKQAWADEYGRKYPPDPNVPHGIRNVLRTGRAEFYPEITDEMLEGSAVDAEHLAAMRGAGFACAMLLPLASRGRTLGAIALVGAHPRRYAPADLAVAEDLARRAALAIDNATLYRDAVRANRVKDEFLATVSHELRTPLNAILGWAKLLGAGRLDGAARDRAAEVIERNAAAQAQLIEDLLDVSRIISGKMRIAVGPVDLAAVVRAAVDSAGPAAEAKRIRVETSAGRGPAVVSGDPSRLQQVVWNLLSNAIKFTPEGGRVEVAVTRDGGSAAVSVRDSGRGISHEFLPYVFERFLQADGSTTRRYGGLGLGLAIVRHIAELHGGTVTADSPGEGLGATFTVRLPLAAPEADAAWDARGPSPARGAAEPLRVDLSGVRVLCVDDEPDARDLLEVGLTQFGAEVRVCASAAEALDVMTGAGGWDPHVLVSDIAMPDEDGYSLIGKVRALEGPRAEIPAVALTALARSDDRDRAFAAGFHAYCRKPCHPDDVAEVIEGLLGSSQ